MRSTGEGCPKQYCSPLAPLVVSVRSSTATYHRPLLVNTTHHYCTPHPSPKTIAPPFARTEAIPHTRAYTCTVRRDISAYL